MRFADFYRLLDRLDRARNFAECSRPLTRAKRGVYFVFEPGEQRQESGSGARVVRVGALR